MQEYQPDGWCILRTTSEKYGQIDRVLGSWTTNAWSLSSSIKKIVDAGDHYEIFEQSGGLYTCQKATQGVVFESLKAAFEKHKSGAVKIINLVKIK